jgi:hypothetical protein
MVYRNAVPFKGEAKVKFASRLSPAPPPPNAHMPNEPRERATSPSCGHSVLPHSNK